MTNRGRIMFMSMWKSALLAGAMTIAPAQAFAAPNKEAPMAEAVAPADDQAISEAATADAKAKMQKEIDQAIAMIEKIFGTDKLPPVAPAQLALAETTTTALIPPGSLEKMLDNLYGKLFKGLLGEFGGLSDTMLSIKTGVDSEQIAALDAKNKVAAADLFDPWRQQREEQITKIVRPLISEALGDLEGPMRSGLARAYARKFSAAQLGEMNAFFATPTGQAYSSEWMALQADPELMLAMIKAVPPLVNKFIDRGPEIDGQFKALPKEKQLTDLSDAELTKLAKLMKVDVKTLKETRDAWNNPPVEDAVEATSDDWGTADAAAEADAADAAAAAAVDVSDEAMEAGEASAAAGAAEAAAYDRSNWSEADRKRVEKLEDASATAAMAAAEAAKEAMSRARKSKLPD